MNDYRILHVSVAFSLKNAVQKLELLVAEAMNEGWKPLGGVTSVGTTLLQTMQRIP